VSVSGLCRTPSEGSVLLVQSTRGLPTRFRVKDSSLITQTICDKVRGEITTLRITWQGVRVGG